MQVINNKISLDRIKCNMCCGSGCSGRYVQCSQVDLQLAERCTECGCGWMENHQDYWKYDSTCHQCNGAGSITEWEGLHIQGDTYKKWWPVAEYDLLFEPRLKRDKIVLAYYCRSTEPWDLGSKKAIKEWLGKHLDDRLPAICGMHKFNIGVFQHGIIVYLEV